MSTNVNPAFSIIGGAGGQKLFLDGELYEGKAGKPKLSITTEIVPVLLGRQPYKFDSSSNFSSFDVLDTGKPVICNGQIIVYTTSNKDILRFDGWDFRSINSLFSYSGSNWRLWSNLISYNNFIYFICYDSYYSNSKTYLYKMSPITGQYSTVFTFPNNSYNEYTKICIIGDNMHILNGSKHQVLNLNTLELTEIGGLPFSVGSETKDIEVIGDVIYILTNYSNLYMYKDSVWTCIISNNNALRLSGKLRLYQHEGKLRSWNTPPLITHDKSDKVDITYLYELNDDSFIIVDTLPFLLLNRDPKTTNSVQGYLFEDKGILYYLGNISYTELKTSSDTSKYQEVSLATGLFKFKRDVTGLEVV